ncbi:transposon Tf2-9 polyprotein [Trichonephila clavipes]|nr:transposon Tf2-9 polyprotein [Trichonephila clavipes]
MLKADLLTQKLVNWIIKLEIAKQEFKFMLDNDIVRPSKSPWASPLHLVNKKDGSIGPCSDYRCLNGQTIPDRYPIPSNYICLSSKNEKASPRQLRHLQYISQFSTNICHISGEKNVVVDSLSKIESISEIDYDKIADAQVDNEELYKLCLKPSLNFK